MSNIKESFDVLKSAMKVDHEYAWSWHANLAVCMQDEGVDWKTSNECAARIMMHVFNVNIHELFPERMIEK